MFINIEGFFIYYGTKQFTIGIKNIIFDNINKKKKNRMKRFKRLTCRNKNLIISFIKSII